MKRFALAVLLSVFALGSAVAQETCQSKAIGKDGRPLAGAALKSFTIKRNGNVVAGTAKIVKKGHAERPSFKTSPVRAG